MGFVDNLDRQLAIKYRYIIMYEYLLFLILTVKLTLLCLFLKQKIAPSELTKHRMEILENIFTNLMILLMIVLFHPFSKNPVIIERETKLFLFTFAILTAFYRFT